MNVSEKINECYRLISRTERESFFHSIANEHHSGENFGSIVSSIKNEAAFFSWNSSILYQFGNKTSLIMNDLYIGITEGLLNHQSKEPKELFISDVFLILNLLNSDIKEELLTFIAALDDDDGKYNDQTYSELKEYLYAEYGFSKRNLYITFQINYLQNFLKTIDAFLFSYDRRFGHYINEITRNKVDGLQNDLRVYHVYPNTHPSDYDLGSIIESKRLTWKGLDSELTELALALITADLIKFEKGKNNDGELGAAFLNTFLHKEEITPQKYYLNIKDVRKRKNDREKILIPKLDKAFDQYMQEGRKSNPHKEE